MYHSQSPPLQLGGPRMGPHMQRTQRRSRCSGAAAMLACLLCLAGCRLAAAADTEVFGVQAGRGPSLPQPSSGAHRGHRHLLQASTSTLATGAATGGNSASAKAEARKGAAFIRDAAQCLSSSDVKWPGLATSGGSNEL